MKPSLSVVMITKNSAELLNKSLKSISGLADEIVIVDDYSTDSTLSIAKKFNAKILLRHEKDLGKQKAFACKQAKGEWLLMIDSDEIISPGLTREIRKTLESDTNISGYFIPYQNHFLGKPVCHGGENYRMLRLAKKKHVIFHPSLVHEKLAIKKGQTAFLNNKIYHYSYRSLTQVFRKFTDYARRDAYLRLRRKERSSLKKLTLYPLHMFCARFIKDKGYRDGFFRIPLDLGFAYMEFLTYFLMALKIKA